MPIRTGPAKPSAVARTASRRPATRARITCACRYSFMPAAVAVTPVADRSRRRTPSSASSTANCWLSAGWAKPISAAARVTLPLSTICTK